MNPALESTCMDLVELQKLGPAIMAEVSAWQEKLSRVTRPIGTSLRSIAREMGVHTSTARRKYDAWKDTKDWRALIDLRKAPATRGLDPAFVEWWCGVVISNKRKIAPAYRYFVRLYEVGDAIPGIPPGLSRASLPRGYSEDNLRRIAPDKFELKAARIGRNAAADLRPLVLSTRVGMEVGQRYVFDDLWHDFEVMVLGQRTPSRLLQLHVHDVFSGCQFTRGIKPRIEDPESGKSVGLKLKEMMFLTVHCLSVYGYHPGGTVLMVENGTAAITKEEEELIYRITGGLVTVQRASMQGLSAFAGQYCGRAKGNFRFKACLESLGNLIHNETANALEFPGQTGSNSRINCPEELHGQQRHLDLLVRVMVNLPPKMQAMLMLPMLEARQATNLVNEVMERINRREDHDLEGYVEAGLTTIDFEVPGVGVITGRKVMELPPEKRAAVVAVATPTARKLSPREVFDGGRGKLVRLRPEQTALLLASIEPRKVKVSGHIIEFQDADISPSPLRYLAHHFRNGDEFGVVVNPLSPEEAHLYTSGGKWVGTVEAWQRISHLDADGLREQQRMAARVENDLLRPLAISGAEFTARRIEQATNNAHVVLKAAKDDDRLGRLVDAALENSED